jgi:hypothetical protein
MKHICLYIVYANLYSLYILITNYIGIWDNIIYDYWRSSLSTLLAFEHYAIAIYRPLRYTCGYYETC